MKNHIVALLIIALYISSCTVTKKSEPKSCNHSLVTLEKKNNGGDYTEISGKVLDLKTGEPIPFAKITLNKDGSVIIGAQTDFEGAFKISKVKLGKYILEIKYLSYENVEIPIDIENSCSIKILAKIENKPILLEKPVIYIYPTAKQQTAIKLNYKGVLKHSYPTYPDSGWKVIAEPNGMLYDNEGKEYYALFWEGIPQTDIIPNEGFIISGKETASFLEEKLAFLGLNRREANEFIMYWLPRMENNPYNLIHFASKSYEEQAELIISPKPETCIRIMMITKPLKTKIDFPLQDLSPLKKTRKGYTIIEWGGCVLNNLEF